MKILIEGKISLKDYYSELCVGGIELVKVLMLFNEQKVKISYYVSETEKTYDECMENELNYMEGRIFSNQYDVRGSEWTGVYAVEETLTFDNKDHNLLKELSSACDKFLCLKIEVPQDEE